MHGKHSQYRQHAVKALVGAGLALAFTANAYAQPDNVPQDKRWYVAPMLSYGFFDHDSFKVGVPGTPGSSKLIDPILGDANEEVCAEYDGVPYETEPGYTVCKVEEPGTPGTQQDVRVNNHDGFGFSLAVGKPITSWLNLEAYGFYFRPKRTFSFSNGNSYSGHGSSWGIGADALLFPMRDALPVFGIVGASWGKMNAKHFTDPDIGRFGGSADATNIDLGVGYLYQLNDYGLKLRAEYRHRYSSVDASDWFDSSLGDVHNGHFNSNIISIGLQIPLGQPPVAPTPEPAPAPQPVQQTFTLSADALFKFDQGDLAGIQPQGREALDNLANKLNTDYTRIDSIVLEGHTDRLGPAAYNQRLSEQRANTVMQYLGSHGVDAPMTAVGKGESEPVTTGCEGDVATNTLIACLQPDRRVEADVTGVISK